MKGKFLFFIVLSVLFMACNRDKKENESTVKNDENTDSVTVKKKVPEIDSNELALQPDNFLKLIDSTSQMLVVDSTLTQEYILTEYRIQPTSISKRLFKEWYKIWHFTTDSLATAYYNDLKTRELVLPMGINKRPKNMFLIGDKIIYLHMENSNGHNYEKYIREFNSVIKLKRNVRNLDSVIGYRQTIYSDYSCKNTEITGAYLGKFDRYIFKHGTFRPFQPIDSSSLFPQKDITIKIAGNKLLIGNETQEVGFECHKMILPDFYLYLKYAYLQTKWDPQMKENEISEDISTHMLKFCESNNKNHGRVTVYKLNGNPYINPIVFIPGSGPIYMQIANRLYVLQKG